jgi:hypothetical protein
MDNMTRCVNLSIRALEKQREKEVLKQLGATQQDRGANLGDILGEAMNKKKEETKE